MEQPDLFLDHMRRVQGMAGGMVQRYGCLDLFSDLCQEGYIALMDAVDRFDESRGFKFWSWGFLKVRGAMINALKQWHWNGVYTYPSTKGNDLVYTLMPLDESFMGSRNVDIVLMLNIKSALDILNDRERYVIIKTYFEGYTLKDVGGEWGLEECTVWEVRRVGLKKMRAYMEQVA